MSWILHTLGELIADSVRAAGCYGALRDLYELIERVIDRCRDTGNLITHIVLKNS